MNELTTIESNRLDRIENIQNRMVDIKVKMALNGTDDMARIRSNPEYAKLEKEHNNLLAQLPG